MAPESARRIGRLARENSVLRLIVSLGCTSALLLLALVSLARFVTGLDLNSDPLYWLTARHVVLIGVITVYWGAGTHFLLVRFGRRRLGHYTLSFALFAVMYIVTALISLPGLVLFAIGHGPPSVETQPPLDVLGASLLQKSLYGVFVVPAGPLIWWLYYRVFARIPC